MRACSAMAFLVARVNTYTIRLVGRWCSNAMLSYIHTNAQISTAGLVERMVQHRDCALPDPPPTTGSKIPSPRLWASPWPLTVYSGRTGIGFVRIWKINSPYHTNINKSIPSSSVDTILPLVGKVVLSTNTCRVIGVPTCTRTHSHVRNLPIPEALVPDIEEGAVNQPDEPPLTFPFMA